MTQLNNTKKTRFKLATYGSAFMALMLPVSMYMGMESLAVTLAGGLFGIISTYQWGETKRQSDKV